jgi:tyrosinase
MKALSAITLVSVSLQAVLALPQADLSPRQTCSSPKVRKEWSKATQAEQSSYIKAALCLATKPSKIGLKTTLYDDFGYIHALLFGQSGFQRSRC